MPPVERARRAGAGKSQRIRERLIRYGRIIAGACLAAAGVLLLVLPGPGVPLLVAGLLLLQHEFRWARALRLELVRRLESVAGAARRIAARLKSPRRR